MKNEEIEIKPVTKKKISREEPDIFFPKNEDLWKIKEVNKYICGQFVFDIAEIKEKTEKQGKEILEIKEHTEKQGKEILEIKEGLKRILQMIEG